jgi:hypothetical protein
VHPANDAPNRTEPFRSVTETETVGSVEKPGFRAPFFLQHVLQAAMPARAAQALSLAEHAARARAALRVHAAHARTMQHTRDARELHGRQPRLALQGLRVCCTRRRKSQLPGKAKSMCITVTIMTRIYAHLHCLHAPMPRNIILSHHKHLEHIVM